MLGQMEVRVYWKPLEQAMYFRANTARMVARIKVPILCSATLNPPVWHGELLTPCQKWLDWRCTRMVM